ncbi:MAG: hypothetical protein HDS68_10485 [Bacteroidales bacterium]|nr:hypothetical protein [Bacteroidales bacterium]
MKLTNDMMKRMIFSLFAVVWSLAAEASCSDVILPEMPVTVSAMTRKLDETLAQRKHLEEHKMQHVDSLRAVLASEGSSNRRYEVYREIIHEFTMLNVDSVMYYCDQAAFYALGRGDSVEAQSFVMQRASWYPTIGVVREAIDEFEAQVAAGVYPQNRVRMFEAGMQMYTLVAKFYPNSALSGGYEYKAQEYADSLLHALSPYEPAYALLEGIVAENGGNDVMAKAHYLGAIDDEVSSAVCKAQAALLLGQMLCDEDNEKEGLYYIAMSAYINALAGNLLNPALEHLGRRFYDQKKLGEAASYLNIALENAVQSASKVEAMRIAEMMPEVSNDYQAHARQKFLLLVVVSVALLLSLVVVVLGFARLQGQMKKMRVLKLQLHQSDAMKEAAISNFLGLCTLYMERLEDFARMVRRKISAGQTDSLYKQLKEEKLADRQDGLLSEVFDRAFTGMFPTFVEDVNALFLPDKRIVTTTPEELTTELRVLAFMRLGVEDTQKVARILGLSLNTVYTYRNKLRARALNRDTFEADVMAIGRID